ncbi:MAG: glycosyltransferase family A protein [Cyanobium sp.]
MPKPQLSIVIIAYNMHREIKRTLYTISRNYQIFGSDHCFEVILVDNGSDIKIEDHIAIAYSDNVRLLRREGCTSPAAAVNYGVSQSSGNLVMICIDGARMFSPGIIDYTVRCFHAYHNPVVATLAWHLGPKPQYLSVEEGYDQQAEDRLLNTIDWRQDGYDLFSISSLAGSSLPGWFKPIMESNCVTIRRSTFDALGGLDIAFQTPGGGLVNMDFYKRACEYTEEVVLLLGEGTFHQFHGGVSTNVPLSKSPSSQFKDEYIRLRGNPYTPPLIRPIYHGSIPDQCLRFMYHSMQQVWL